MTDPQQGKVVVGLFFVVTSVATRALSDRDKRRLDAKTAGRTFVEGWVVDNIAYDGPEDSTSYCAVISYQVDGTEHRFQSRRSTVGPGGERKRSAWPTTLRIQPMPSRQS
jgi:hypothetical protein